MGDRGRASDFGHLVGALHYIFDHCLLLEWFAIPTSYCWAFAACAAVMLFGFILAGVVEKTMGLPHFEREKEMVAKKHAVSKLDPSVRRLLFFAELMGMLGEYGLFIVFVVAMPMGLR